MGGVHNVSAELFVELIKEIIDSKNLVEVNFCKILKYLCHIVGNTLGCEKFKARLIFEMLRKNQSIKKINLRNYTNIYISEFFIYY